MAKFQVNPSADVKSLSEFNPKLNNWANWKENFKDFLAQQSIQAGEAGEVKKRAFLLVAIGENAFHQLWDKMVPSRPSTKSYVELMAILDGIFSVDNNSKAADEVKWQQQNNKSQTQFESKFKSHQDSCTRCGKSNHLVDQCRIPASVMCYKCEQPGHLATICPNRRGNEEETNSIPVQRPHQEEEAQSSDIIVSVKASNSMGPKPFHQSFPVNGRPVIFDIDTGAIMSLVGEQVRKEELGSPKLRQSSVQLKSLNVEHPEVNQFNQSMNGSAQSELSKSPSLSAAELSPGSPVEATIAAMDNQLDNSPIPALPCQASSENASNFLLVGKEDGINQSMESINQSNQLERLAPRSQLEVQLELKVRKVQQKKLKIQCKNKKSSVQSGDWKKLCPQFQSEVQKTKTQFKFKEFKFGNRKVQVFTKFRKKSEQKINQLRHRHQTDKAQVSTLMKSRVKKGRPKVKMKPY